MNNTPRIAPGQPLYTFDIERLNGEPITDLQEIGGVLSDIFTPGEKSWVPGVDFGEDFPEGYDPRQYVGRYWINPRRLTQDDYKTLHQTGGWLAEPDLRRSIEVFFP
jgi:hypothetical protein